MDDSSADGNPLSNSGGEEVRRSAEGVLVEMLGTHERSLFGYIYSLTGNWDDSQELMQRLRIRIWEQFSEYDRSRPFGPWARAIAYYLVLGFRTERSRQRCYFTENIIKLLDETYASAGDEPQSPQGVLVDCLGKLSNNHREMVTAYYEPDGPAKLAKSYCQLLCSEFLN